LRAPQMDRRVKPGDDSLFWGRLQWERRVDQ
jgi:hypothetical protein